MNRVNDRWSRFETADGLFDGIFGRGFSEFFFRDVDNINQSRVSGFKSEYSDCGTKAKFTFELPGVNPETVAVSVDGKIINLSFMRGDDKKKYEIIVNFEPDASKVTATCKFGILTINVEKLQKQSGHPIKINIE